MQPIAEQADPRALKNLRCQVTLWHSEVAAAVKAVGHDGPIRGACSPDGLTFEEIEAAIVQSLGHVHEIIDQLALTLPQSTPTPSASLVFDASDENHVQFGQVVRKVSDEKIPCDEYIYAIGVVNVRMKPISGCKMVLQDSDPHDTSQQRWGRAMRVRNDPNKESDGVFTLNPRDGKQPSAYVEVLREVVPIGNQSSRKDADIQLQYANTAQGHPNWFTQGRHVLTFRLEGDMSQSLTFQLSANYSPSRCRWIVAAKADLTKITAESTNPLSEPDRAQSPFLLKLRVAGAGVCDQLVPMFTQHIGLKKDRVTKVEIALYDDGSGIDDDKSCVLLESGTKWFPDEDPVLLFAAGLVPELPSGFTAVSWNIPESSWYAASSLKLEDYELEVLFARDLEAVRPESIADYTEAIVAYRGDPHDHMWWDSSSVGAAPRPTTPSQWRAQSHREPPQESRPIGPQRTVLARTGGCGRA